ncbi:MAG: ADP-ribosylglycohydrolase family protein [Lachnospiraceae bacterium]
MSDLLSKFKGCILGGAAGDALGYPVEFLKMDEIIEEYGQDGITAHKLYNHKALVSDDTQMTLYTACGLLKGYTRFVTRGIMGDWVMYVHRAYQDWRYTQFSSFGKPTELGACWLLNMQDMYSCRAPGNTCLSALETNRCGKTYSPLNNSMGCGGVMRVAPVGLYLPRHLGSIEEVDQVGAEVAAITHGNPLAYIPAAALVHIIAKATTTNDDLETIVKDARSTVGRLYAEKEGVDIFELFMDKAVALAHEDINDLDAIRELGEGWLGLEALAIAVYCSIKYQDDFEKAICVAVNHDGDSDSTGSITGNILGAYHGIEKIPEKFLENLELRDIMDTLIMDLYNDCPFEDGEIKCEEWKDKYIMGTYGKGGNI